MAWGIKDTEINAALVAGYLFVVNNDGHVAGAVVDERNIQFKAVPACLPCVVSCTINKVSGSDGNPVGGAFKPALVGVDHIDVEVTGLCCTVCAVEVNA